MSSLSDFIGAGGAKVWVSGSTVKQWQYVISPLDGELYQRITATGAGTTDPANDLTNYAAKSFQRSSTIGASLDLVNGVPGWTNTTTASGFATIVSPAISTGVRGSVLSITGRGYIDFLATRVNGAGNTSNIRVEVILDDRTIFDQTLTTNGKANGVFWPFIGYVVPTATTGDYLPLLNQGVAFKRNFNVFMTPTAATVTNRQFIYAYRGEL